jgi:hypothetical protein
MRFVCFALLCAGCGGGSTGGQDMAQSPDLSGQVETCMTDNMPVALAASYGVRGSLNVNVKVPADGSLFDMDAQSQILLLAQMTQAGSSVTVKVQACHIQIPPVALKGQPPTVLTAADTLVQSVPAVTAMATLTGANTCAGFSSMPIPIVLGAKLAAPATDPLPVYMSMNVPPVALCGGMASVTCAAATDSACICDQEADAKPGATVGAMNIPVLSDVDQIYLALRTVVSLDGMVFPPSAGQQNPGQRIRGKVSGLSLEQSPVGCHQTPAPPGTPSDCDPPTVTSVAGLNPVVTQSVNTDSTFVAMPVPAGWTCTDLITNAATLFKGQ